MGSDESPRIAGTWHPPLSSRAIEADLSMPAPDEVAATARDPGARELARGPLAAITVSARVGAIPRRIGFADGSVFETSDNDGVDRLLGQRIGRAASAVSALERFRPRLALFVVAIAALSFAIYRFAVPVLVEVAVAVTPPVVPELMSRSVLASLDKAVFSPSDLPQARRDEIAAGFATLTEKAGRGPGGYTLHFRDGGLAGPNAFALPDGSLVLTDQLVALAGEDDDAVLGVLGHEIGHVEHAHSLRQLYRAAGVAGLIMLIGGDVGGGAEDLLAQGAALASLSHSRAAESEADRYSVEIMARSGRDPAAIARFFELMRDRVGAGGGGFFSTHPATDGRIEETRRYAEEVEDRPAQ